MDLKKIFRGISSKLENDFKISSEINHNGSKGTYRENALKYFLNSGRLPKRYGIGSGEIIGHTRDVSKQCDLILYDQFDSVSLLYDENIQVYPIESIYGVIEVKSSLSKKELFKALDNIKSIKSLTADNHIKQSSGFSTTYSPREKPFGMIFAYSLENNSLQSLVENVKQWEKDNIQENSTNLIVVLNEGIIYHHDEYLKSLYSSKNLKNAKYVSYLSYTNDTLFHFYSILLNLCTNMRVGGINLENYFKPSEQIGNYIVKCQVSPRCTISKAIC